MLGEVDQIEVLADQQSFYSKTHNLNNSLSETNESKNLGCPYVSCHSYNEYFLIETIHVAEIIAVKHFPAIRILGTSGLKYEINKQINKVIED